VAAPFELLEHPADIGIRARGATPAELFENAASGLIAIALDPEHVAERESRALVAEAPDREALLVNFLQELVWLIDGEGWLVRRVTVDEISETAARATAWGEPRRGQTLRLIIKAVTFHQLAVRQSADGWEAEVYLDI